MSVPSVIPAVASQWASGVGGASLAKSTGLERPNYGGYLHVVFLAAVEHPHCCNHSFKFN